MGLRWYEWKWRELCTRQFSVLNSLNTTWSMWLKQKDNRYMLKYMDQIKLAQAKAEFQKLDLESLEFLAEKGEGSFKKSGG